jgi:hypothetical protein
MRSRALATTVATMFSLVGAMAQAQIATGYSLHCENAGMAPHDALGDRDGHAMSVSNYTCRVAGGPLDGGVLTGTQHWEWQGPNATGLGGNSVMRHGKGTMVAAITESKSSLKMDGDKITGFGGGGTGRYVLATGAAAYLHKTFSYTYHSTGFNQFVVDVTVQ